MLNTVEPYITDYARMSIECYGNLKKDYPHNATIYDKAIQNITGAVNARRRGLITVDETMRAILNCLDE